MGEVVAVGADLEPGTVLEAYRRGLFPMHLPDGRLAWWSPVRRGVIPLGGMRVTRSLRRSARNLVVTVDTAFEAVIDSCADPRRPDGWINRDIRECYLELHRLGWAHSVETWTPEGAPAGGLYGVAIGGGFFGESMFHRERDGSKVALLHLVTLLREAGAHLLDVQWATDHLVSLGAVEISRSEYLRELEVALAAPLPDIWRRPRA